MSTKRNTLTDDARRRLEFVHQDAPMQPDKPAPAPRTEPQRVPEEPTVNQSYRLPKSLVVRLRQIVIDRKASGIQPSSANAIAAEAIERWLDEEEKPTRMQT